MIRIRTLVATTAISLALPFGATFAQTPGTAPAAPITNPARTLPAFPDNVPSPMQEQATAPGLNRVPTRDVCGPSSPSSSATMMDEFGRSYNCRGDRIR